MVIPNSGEDEVSTEDIRDEFLVERDVDENVANNMISAEKEALEEDGPMVPEVPKVGFPIRRRNSKKGDDGKMKYVTLTCGREGRKPTSTSGSSKRQPTIQIDYKTRITASTDIYGIWRINIVHLEHNHKTSPSKSRLYSCNRELNSNVKRKLEVNDMAEIPLHKSFNSVVVEAGENENMSYVEKDCRNYIEQVRQLRLGEEDAAMIQSYFSKMQAQCLGFYFSMDLDDDSRSKNVFWADNRSSVNHHRQSTLLGCGLLSNEDTNIFAWIFRTWLQCMHSKAPHGISTDQDRAMQNAFVKEFEDGWRAIINTYDLHSNEWLSGLFDNRVRWVPCYLKLHFGQGRQQLSEVRYERVLRNKVEKEFQDNFKSYSQMVPCTTMFEMEKQYQKCNTIAKFRKVQVELTGKVYCDILSSTEGPSCTTYEIREVVMLDDDRRKIKRFDNAWCLVDELIMRIKVEDWRCSDVKVWKNLSI
ncbi:protein FAR-RED IMPAIRED RESPONSE 1-like [Olea europaea var. sylvestris]|uniref:protein FAR-RED IMPAIRED RESPONSE 1-like n=1 Tax=Olea europaea var. sylvestris TaxID=158386 RepID=UPI000C1D88B1|nr:protein FAR-RED IMPAIRED RESPONSE 1-like [Olea europaea var. sylvestris]